MNICISMDCRLECSLNEWYYDNISSVESSEPNHVTFDTYELESVLSRVVTIMNKPS